MNGLLGVCTGLLSEWEWAQAMRRAFPAMLLPWNHMRQLVGLQSTDDEVDYVQFLEALDGFVQHSAQNELCGLYHPLGPLQYVFQLLDANGDGFVTKSEMQQR